MTGNSLIQFIMKHSFTCNVSVLISFTVFAFLFCNRFIICPEAAHCPDSTGIVDCSDRGVLTSEEKETLPIYFSCFLCCHSGICCERNSTLRMQWRTNSVKYLGFCSFLLSLNNNEEYSTRSSNEGSMDSLSARYIGFNGSNNGITEIPCFVQWSVLKWVDLSNNKITRIVRRLYFGKHSSLKTLILKNNFIHVILPYVFSRLTHLKHVFLNENPCVDDWSFLQTSSSLIILDYRGINSSSCLDCSLCGSCRNGTTVILNEMALIKYKTTCAQNKTFCSFVSEWPERIQALTSGFPLEVCTDKDGDLSTEITSDKTLITVLPRTTEPSFTDATKKWVPVLFVLAVILLFLLILAGCSMKSKSRFWRYGQFYSTRISMADPQRDDLCSETYYSIIPENTTKGKLFYGNEVNLIVSLKNGPLYHRWMGTVASNDGNRCVISLTVAENALSSQTVHWDEFVRNSLNLPGSQHLANVEGIYFRNESIYLVQEYLNCETLCVRLQRCMASSSTTLLMMATSEVIRYLLGILEGLQFLHSFGFLHPGLSTKKVLLTNKGVCKLYDFCLDKDAGSIVNIKKSQMACDMNQFSPEALYENIYTKASDLWSTAVVIWEILSGHAPFGSHEQAITDKEPSKAWPEQYKTMRNDLLYDCWQVDCPLRPSVQALRSSFVEISHSLVNEIPGAASRDVTEGYIPMSRIMDHDDNA